MTVHHEFYCTKYELDKMNTVNSGLSANGTSQKPMAYARAGPNSRQWKACTWDTTVAWLVTARFRRCSLVREGKVFVKNGWAEISNLRRTIPSLKTGARDVTCNSSSHAVATASFLAVPVIFLPPSGPSVCITSCQQRAECWQWQAMRYRHKSLNVGPQWPSAQCNWRWFSACLFTMNVFTVDCAKTVSALLSLYKYRSFCKKKLTLKQKLAVQRQKFSDEIHRKFYVTFLHLYWKCKIKLQKY